MATCKMFGNALIKALNKEVALGNGATGLKVMLLTNAVVPDQDKWIYKSSITTEVTGGNYAAGGIPLTNVTVSYTEATNVIMVDAADAVWSNSTITARYAVIYDSTPSTDDKKPLLGYVDFGTDQVSTNGDFKLVWDAAGIFSITIA